MMSFRKAGPVLKSIGFYILGLCVPVCCVQLAFFTMPLVDNSPNPGGDEHFILFIIIFIIVAISIPVITAFFFWRSKRIFSIGIITAPIAVPLLIAGSSLLFFKLLFWNNIDRDYVIEKLENYKNSHGSYPLNLEQIEIKTDRGDFQAIEYRPKDGGFIFCSEFMFFDSAPGECYFSKTQKWEYWDRRLKVLEN